MKVLVLERGVKERSLIQNALEKSGHEMIVGEDPAQALRLIEAGETRFVIADHDAGDSQNVELIKRIRSSKTPSVYILMLTSADEDSTDADDTLHKPLTASELKARIMIGQRFLSLSDSLIQARDQIDNMALYDPLTGMLNRNAFYRTAHGELERARRGQAPFSLIALDIDNFKTLNETYGLGTGDEVLKILSQTIREKSRPYDCIGRWSGDEFLIALPSVIGTDAEKIAERVMKGIQATSITYQDQTLTVAMSGGIASVLKINASLEIEPLISQARQAMLRAKEDGGNQVNLTYI